MMVPLQNDLRISVDTMTNLTLVPAAGSLLVVFLIGALGDRISRRSIIAAGAICYMVGAVLMITAANVGMALAGRLLGGTGAITMLITGLASLNDSVDDEASRGRVFGIFAALTPATFIFGGLVASVVCQFTSWRVVPVLWFALGALVLVRLRTLPSPATIARSRNELVTPILAGVGLACLGLAFTTWATSTTVALTALTASFLAIGALVITMRMMKHPTLDLRVLRVRGSMAIVLAILLVTSTNFFFYVNLFLQYRFAVPLWELSILMVIPQVSAVAGGLLGGRLATRFGAPLTASLVIAVSGTVGLGFLLLQPGSPVWMPVVVLTVSALPTTACVGPLTQSLLDRAPEGGSAATSSIRSAAWSLGPIIGGVAVGAVVYRTFTQSLSHTLVDAGLAAEAAATIAERVRSGEFVAQIADQLRITNPAASAELESATTGLASAQVEAMHALALVGFAAYAVATALLLAAHFRRPLEQNATVGVKIQPKS